MKEEVENLKKFIAKFRFYLALLVVVITISNVTILSNHSKSPEMLTTNAASGEWGSESR